MDHHLPQLIHLSLRKGKLLPPFESSALEPWSYLQNLLPGQIIVPHISLCPSHCQGLLFGLPASCPAPLELIWYSRAEGINAS